MANLLSKLNWGGTEYEIKDAQARTDIEAISRTKTYSGISVNVTPTALSTYNTWDTKKIYGYSADVTINGLTANSMIQNIILSDTLSSSISDIVQTSTDKLTFYTKTAGILSGTIITLNTLEV